MEKFQTPRIIENILRSFTKEGGQTIVDEDKNSKPGI